MNKGPELYRRAKQIIPGGTMLLSKRPEMFLPKIWPSYFKKCKDIFVWDLDGNKYRDFSHMGVGTNTLGYANKKIDRFVKKAVKTGNMSTLNCPEEVELAERLLNLHEWADMARFARSGGEANAIATRIARAAAGKDKIAICGYHGWHDWYLAANLKNQNDLSSHLLDGLNISGVPKVLSGTTIPFNYNDIDAFENIVNQNSDLGVVKMEVVRSSEPKPGYLQSIREICTKKGIVLIFDECTSGFRESYGGIHLKYGVMPDLCMFGKALGNGYAITAVIGKKEIMKEAESTFISSTFWTEKIGPTAGIASLDEMKRLKSWEIISKKGGKLKENWRKVAENNNLEIQISGIDALATFKLNCDNWLKYKTYISQEMLSANILASNSVYMSTKHSDKSLEMYCVKLNEIFKMINKFENQKLDINKYLVTDVCHEGFQRLN